MFETPFPFLWGAATSAHQVEGNNFSNDWWAWEQAGKVQEPSGIACDQYQRFREDIELISNLGHNAHRFSLEWSRCEPKENCWNEEAFQHYEEVLKELRARNIEPIVTLHHFTHPQWFADLGGWLHPDAVHYFVRYVNRVIRALGPYVRIWITLNEPLVYLYYGFLTGLWPPGRQSFPEALKILRCWIQAHIESHHQIHSYYERSLQRPVWVSVAKHATYFEPCRTHSFQDRGAVFLRNWFFNDLFFNAVHSGFLFFPGIYCETLSRRGAMDFLGLNYYARHFIRFGGLSQGDFLGTVCEEDHHTNPNPERNMMGWDVYPEGLYRLLRRFGRYQLPMLICENGICTLEDTQRERYVRSHLEAVQRARGEGLPVLGYLHWSLLDNFEWAHGFEPRFGIVEVHQQDQTRKVRPSAHVLTDICRKISNGE